MDRGLRRQALAVLLEADPGLKAQAAQALAVSELSPGDCAESITLSAEEQARLPGRPAKPRLVEAKQVPTRSPFTLEGRAALLHAICHIEFNAIK